MCDDCDCRRIPEIARLGEEHERIQDLADAALRLARAGSPHVADGVERLRQALSPRVSREEYDLFPTAAQVLSEEQWEAVSARSPGEPAGAPAPALRSRP